MQRNKAWLRAQFESNSLGYIRKLKFYDNNKVVKTEVSHDKLNQVAIKLVNEFKKTNWWKLGKQQLFLRRNHMVELLRYTLKLIVTCAVVYVFAVNTATVLLDNLLNTLVERKESIRDWASLSVKSHGIVYAAIEVKGEPEAAFAAAKYFEKLGDLQSALELTKLSMNLNKDQMTREQHQIQYKEYMERITIDLK